jgi:hypothetical protein
MKISEYEARRAEKIAQNKALLQELQLENAKQSVNPNSAIKKERSTKKRKLSERPAREPSRVSARIAAVETRPIYSEEKIVDAKEVSHKSKGRARVAVADKNANESKAVKRSPEELDALQSRWSAWAAEAPLPIRDENGTFHFVSDPDFVPNKSPAEVIREGSFGGTYFRPLFSKVLGMTIAGDWQELPDDWIEGVNIEAQLTSSNYDPEVNKYGVQCGQTIEEWEANGWINHDYDVRGWFQWYCRFFLGRRCDDDERQIGRWKKCVGERGRWRRTLLKKYVAAGIRSVADDGDDDVEGVSPAIHQTCHHWAYEVRQDVLDRWWAGDRD